MAGSKIIRITGVREKAGNVLVAYYADDIEREVAWGASAPGIGDVYEINLGQPSLNPKKISSPAPGGWQADSDALRWRKQLGPDKLSRMEILRRRHLARQGVRAYLDSQGFIEIDAPLLVRGTTPEPAVESFPVGDRYLTPSTEYQMKRLAIGGIDRLYSLTQNFRLGDAEGDFRNPEFTMLEWGRVGASIRDVEQDAENLTLAAMQKLGLDQTITYQGKPIKMNAPWERLSVLRAIERHVGVVMKDFELDSCRKAAEASGLPLRREWREDRDFLFSLLMNHIQPQLGAERPVFLTDWPLYQTTSAQMNEETKLAERSELFVAGIEISDGFAGLANADLQEQFFGYALETRKKTGQPAVTLDSKYLEAMRLGAPNGAGMALGFDRLVMLLTDQPAIKNVLALAWDEL